MAITPAPVSLLVLLSAYVSGGYRHCRSRAAHRCHRCTLWPANGWREEEARRRRRRSKLAAHNAWWNQVRDGLNFDWLSWHCWVNWWSTDGPTARRNADGAAASVSCQLINFDGQVRFRWVDAATTRRVKIKPVVQRQSHGQKRNQQDEQEEEEEAAATATAVEEQEEEEEEVETNDDWKRDRTRKPSPGGGAAAGFKLHRLCHPGLLFAVDSSN